jgi:glycine/D-amino acid oxidase-like deaminating enzyme
LADAVERRGVVIHERTRATALQPGLVQTNRGDVEAAAVLRCTEAFTVDLPGTHREVIPVYSLMVATEPLPEAAWQEIGLAARQTFHDGRHLVIYGQRTADGRLAFGGRGAPYHFGSSVRPSHDTDDRTHAGIEAVLRRLFPQIGGARVTHRWGGAVAMPRDLQAAIAFDPATGTGRAGGYVGLGVAASNLAGRTLADLVLRRPTDLTRLPWVGHRSRAWEPEPLRWVGVNALRSLAPAADRAEERTGRPSKVLGGVLHWFIGH